MCTATFVPLKNNHYLLTHNRDERYSRGLALPPVQQSQHDVLCTYPVDSDRGGTWILSHAHGSVCLLNGAEHTPLTDTTYPKSRGDIPFLILKYESLSTALNEISFEGYGPFTLIVIAQSPELSLSKLSWDLEQVKLTQYDSSLPYIFSSTTLYSPEERARRENLFDQFIQNSEVLDRDALLEFHTQGFSAGKEGIVIDRAETQRKTVSVSSIEINATPSFYYEDLISQEQRLVSL